MKSAEQPDHRTQYGTNTIEHVFEIIWPKVCKSQYLVINAFKQIIL